MPRVIHFETPAEDPARAARFYADVFGWQTHKWDGPEDYWLLMTGEKDQPGIDGGLMKACDDSPTRAVINTIDVPSVDDYVEKITKAGGSVVMPKTTVPGIGFLAYCKDTEGVTFGIMQMEKVAA